MFKQIKIIIGKTLYSTVGRFLPTAHCRLSFLGRISKAFRALCGKLILEKCGNNVNIYSRARFSSIVEIGDNSDIGSKARLNGKVVIGNNVIMGPDVLIFTTNHNISDPDIPIKYQGNMEMKPVYIEDNCWIGMKVIILPGVTIGRDSVIGAGAVVGKSIPPYSVAVGNPARVIRNRCQV